MGVEQVEHARADEHVLLERHRSMFVDDDGDLASDSLNPVAEFFGVADRRRQAHHPHRRIEPEDDLLPDRTTKTVGKEVHLVHHHMRESL
ncbi:Uncharacterised protein [Mycobacteroides abscessus subsp. abscessus]|nr:Uncharacterised protein [Mycobacteroides abscessus subsp. abscessus]